MMAEVFPIAPSADSTVSLSFRTNGDAAGWLPEPAADRLKGLRQRAEDAYKLLPDRERLDALRLEKFKSMAHLDRLRRPAAEDGFSLAHKSDHPAIKDEQAKLDGIIAELKRLEELDAARATVWTTRGQLLQRIEAWLRGDGGRPSGTTLAPVLVEAPLKKGETVTAGIDRLRHRLRELGGDLHRIRSAPFPSAEAKQKMRVWGDKLASAAEPDTSRLVEILDDVAIPTQQITSQVFNVPNSEGAVAFTHQPDVLGFIFWAFHDEVVAKLDAAIATEADDKQAIGSVERAEQEATIMADILANERIECDLIAMAERGGQIIEHRPDVSPLAVLGIELVVGSPAPPKPGKFLAKLAACDWQQRS